jgi:acetolactate synthase I/II/III large subunit
MSDTLRGADVVRSLHHLGCRRMFTLSNNHIMSISDAALDARIDLVHVRHETSAVRRQAPRRVFRGMRSAMRSTSRNS